MYITHEEHFGDLKQDNYIVQIVRELIFNQLLYRCFFHLTLENIVQYFNPQNCQLHIAVIDLAKEKKD